MTVYLPTDMIETFYNQCCLYFQKLFVNLFSCITDYVPKSKFQPGLLTNC